MCGFTDGLSKGGAGVLGVSLQLFCKFEVLQNIKLKIIIELSDSQMLASESPAELVTLGAGPSQSFQFSTSGRKKARM